LTTFFRGRAITKKALFTIVVVVILGNLLPFINPAEAEAAETELTLEMHLERVTAYNSDGKAIGQLGIL